MNRKQELIAIDERLAEIHKTIQTLSNEANLLEEKRMELCDISVLDYDCPHNRANDRANDRVMEVRG